MGAGPAKRGRVAAFFAFLPGVRCVWAWCGGRFLAGGGSRVGVGAVRVRG